MTLSYCEVSFKILVLIFLFQLGFFVVEYEQLYTQGGPDTQVRTNNLNLLVYMLSSYVVYILLYLLS